MLQQATEMSGYIHVCFIVTVICTGVLAKLMSTSPKHYFLNALTRRQSEDYHLHQVQSISKELKRKRLHFNKARELSSSTDVATGCASH